MKIIQGHGKKNPNIPKGFYFCEKILGKVRPLAHHSHSPEVNIFLYPLPYTVPQSYHYKSKQ